MHGKRLLVPLVLIAGTVLAACGSPLPFSTAHVGGAVAGQATSGPVPAVAAPARTSAEASTGVPFAPASPKAGLAPLPVIGPMVIKNASLTIRVADPEATLSDVDRTVASEQGTINSQSIRYQGDAETVELALQVPADKFEGLLAQLRDLRAPGSHVVVDTVSGQDVTQQYQDTQAQLQNLRVSRAAYQSLLSKATKIGDVIALTRELTTVQTQIDELQGRQQYLSQRAAVSTINLTVQPLSAGSASGTTGGIDPAGAAGQAWQALLNGLRGLAVGLIWLAVLAPLPCLVGLGGWLVFRRVRRPVA
ncbi:MAG: DUF4349 domain-containing protein [Chloroflexota bacterium]